MKRRIEGEVGEEWGTFFVLDLGLDIVDGVGGLDLEGDCLSG